MDALICIDCGDEHGPEVAICSCGGALDHAGGLPPVAKDDLHGDGPGLWRYAGTFQVPAEHAVSLGEGGTPLVHDERLGAGFKLEYLNPTGSFKDRGACVTVSMAQAVGATRVVEDSSGNAGAACAAYAGQAGIGCTIFSPTSITQAKRQRIEALGAELQVVQGKRSEVTQAAVDAADQPGTYYANHTYPPHFLDGCSTIAYELAEDPAGLPDVLITPCAMGSVLLGTYRGFQRLAAGGIIEPEAIPRLVAVQAQGFDPVVRALGGRTGPGENTLADGLLIPDPPRLDQLVDAVQATDGTAIAIDEPTTRHAMQRLHQRGLLAEPSSAVTLAALQELHGTAWLAEDEQAALVLTGGWTPG